MQPIKLEIRDKDIINIVKFLRIKNKKLLRFIAAVELFFDRLEKNHVFLLAAGIAFNILMYLLPLLLIAIYVVNMVFGINSVTGFLTQTLEHILPPHGPAMQMLQSMIQEVYFILAKSSLAGWIGILTLLWLSSILYSSLRTGLNTIFNISTPKTYFFYKIRDMFLILVIAILVLVSSFFFPLLSVVQSFLISSVPEQLSFVVSKLYLTLMSLGTSFILFYLLFRFVPNKRMPRLTRVISTATCVLLIEVSRHVFSWYIVGVSAYGKFYGTYAILASIALWIYYLTLIIMLSAEFSQLVYQIRKTNRMAKRAKEKEMAEANAEA